MFLAALLIKNSAVCANSLGSINAFFGMGSNMILCTTSSSDRPCSIACAAICFSTNGVLTYAGHSVLIVTSQSPVSKAIVLAKPSNPCFAATYADLNGEATKECTEPTLIIRP